MKGDTKCAGFLYIKFYVAVHGLKLEIRNWGERKRVYELDVYKLAEALSDMVWHDFDKWNKKVQNTVGYQIIRSSSWLRKLIRRKSLSESRAIEYKAIVEKLGPKLNAFVNSTKA
ncbi:MAG: hypothetical protein U9P80_10345 [Thermodesulfobacteriota bacterium]|nr:hypothetical protein [Thermodesulfobacteriota bacterium]